MLSLKSRTPLAFVKRYEADIKEMLIDHAHCEKKAASTALNLIFRYPERADVVKVAAEIVEEEIQHFQQVCDLLESRSWSFERQRPSKYGGRLAKLIRNENDDESGAFTDRMLVCALIEARSCERFQLLGEHLADPELAEFYRSLFESEARHYATYLKLALAYGDEKEVRARMEWMSEQEAAICEVGERAPRLHA